jgi:ABC-2 type transport system permease protein
VRVAVVDPAPDFATRALTTRLAATRRFQLVGVGATARDVEPLFRAGRADIAVIFEPGFGARLGGQGAQPARLMLAVDASDPNSGTTMLTYVRAVIAAQEAEWLGAGTGRSTGVRLHVESRMRFNPTLESVNLFVPGLIALVLTLVCALMSAISLSREKERGTLEVLLVSPLRPTHIIAGKVIPYLGLAFANVLTALAAAWLVFGVPFRGSLVLLLAASMLFSIVSLGIGVLVAARTTSQRAAMLTAMLATLLPSTLLSGMVFPIASMPAWLALISNVVPARWFIVIARGVMLKGVGIAHLWPELLVLTGMMVVLLAAATRSFKPRLA